MFSIWITVCCHYYTEMCKCHIHFNSHQYTQFVCLKMLLIRSFTLLSIKHKQMNLERKIWIENKNETKRGQINVERKNERQSKKSNSNSNSNNESLYRDFKAEKRSFDRMCFSPNRGAQMRWATKVSKSLVSVCCVCFFSSSIQRLEWFFFFFRFFSLHSQFLQPFHFVLVYYSWRTLNNEKKKNYTYILWLFTFKYH